MYLYVHIIILTHQIPLSGQAKPKKARVIKPTENPDAAEPALPTPAPGQPEAPEDPAVNVQIDPPEPSVDETVLNPSTVEPSSSANPPETYDNDVLITGSRFVKPGNQTVLARHSAKQEVMERQKVRFDVSHYTHLSIGEVLSGYLSQVNSIRDSEIEMVKQLYQKYEVCHSAYIYILSAPKSSDYEKT